MALQDRPDARGSDDDAHGGELTVDAAVAPSWVLLRQAQDERGGALCDAWTTGSIVRVGPALGDEVPVPAQERCRLNEEASETVAGSSRASPASTARSAGSSAGLWTWRRRTVTSWRSITTSMAISVLLRK